LASPFSKCCVPDPFARSLCPRSAIFRFAGAVSGCDRPIEEAPKAVALVFRESLQRGQRFFVLIANGFALALQDADSEINSSNSRQR
jgi:hypothetical protein